MTAEEHNKTLATLHFVYGAMHGLTLLGLALLVFVAKMASPVSNLISTFWISIGILVFLLLLIAAGLLPLLVGYALLKRKLWVKPLALFLAVISLINVPIGTALGIYTLKFFKSEGGIRLYGGTASTTTENELQDALTATQPLMDRAMRSR